MTDLDTLLESNPAPSVRGNLSTRILAAANQAEPANDTRSRRPWWSLGGIAAMAIMATLFVVQPSSHSVLDDAAAEAWEQIADGSGFSDLYDWVEGEDS
jgi:hypothetical protein